MKPELLDAINALIENAQVSVIGDENEGFEVKFFQDTKVVSNEEILKKLKELQAEYDSKQYQRDRASQYPSIQEQLDMQYWDAVNGTNKWQEAVAKVKTDNPKPE